jgi:hypothetical protein
MVFATAATARASTLWEYRLGPFYSRSLLWDAADLTEPRLRALYEQLSPELANNRAWTVQVFTDRTDAGRESGGKMGTEADYERWWKLYNGLGGKLLPMAEVLVYEKNAVLRLRNSAGVCSEVVLSGDNFLRTRLGSVSFEVLEIYYHSLPPGTAPSDGDEAMVTIFVRASAFPDEDQARQFSLLMQNRFEQKRIIVVFRSDAFFLTDEMFPIIYRFDPAAAPPSREEYERSKTMYCFCDRPGVLCR